MSGSKSWHSDLPSFNLCTKGLAAPVILEGKWIVVDQGMSKLYVNQVFMMVKIFQFVFKKEVNANTLYYWHTLCSTGLLNVIPLSNQMDIDQFLSEPLAAFHFSRNVN